jgi:precorrin-6B methylase 2
MKNGTYFKKTFFLLMLVAFCLPVIACDIKEGNPLFSEDELDVPYHPTPITVVEEMLRLAEVKPDDVVYDLGCGDGRIVVTAAKLYGVKAVGVDLDPERVEESKENVRKNGVENLVTIRQQNIFDTDLSEASVVTLYLYPSVNLALKPTLQNQLKPGSRIVSHAFDMGDWEPEKEVTVEYKGALYDVFLWRIPEKTP